MRRTSRIRKRKARSGNRVLIFSTGGLVTAVALVLILISLEKPSGGSPDPEKSPDPPKAGRIAVKPAPEPAPKTQFTFYETLKTMEAEPLLNDDFDPGSSAGSSATPQAPTTTSKQKFSVQVAALGSQKASESLAQKLRRSGYPVQVHPLAVPNRGMLYRVRVGSFGKRSEAEKLARKLKQEEGLSPYVISRGE